MKTNFFTSSVIFKSFKIQSVLFLSLLAFSSPAKALTFFVTMPQTAETDLERAYATGDAEAKLESYAKRAGLETVLNFTEADRKAVPPEPKPGSSYLKNFPNLYADLKKPEINYKQNFSGDKKQLNCLAEAIYFEARGEGDTGGQAVGEVVLNRASASADPSDLCKITYQQYKGICQFSYACDEERQIKTSSESWSRSQKIASDLLNNKVRRMVTDNALFFHATHVKPGWASKMTRTASIGSHLFYKPR